MKELKQGSDMKKKWVAVTGMAAAAVACCAIICGVIGYVATGSLPWVFAEVGHDAKRKHAAIVDGPTEEMMAAMQLWDAKREADIGQAIAGASELAAARASLAGVKSGIPREVAICLEARARADKSLRAAITGGGDLAEKIEKYKASRQPIENYCQYALQIGPPL